MFLESPKVITDRQEAARKWIEFYAEKTRHDQEKGHAERALAVIVLTPKTSDWLAEHDPMALRQAHNALSEEKNYMDFMPKKVKE